MPVAENVVVFSLYPTSYWGWPAFSTICERYFLRFPDRKQMRPEHGSTVSQLVSTVVLGTPYLCSRILSDVFQLNIIRRQPQDIFHVAYSVAGISDKTLFRWKSDNLFLKTQMYALHRMLRGVWCLLLEAMKMPLLTWSWSVKATIAGVTLSPASFATTSAFPSWNQTNIQAAKETQAA